MDHLTQPLEALRARALAWLRDGRARVLAVPVDPELGDGAGALLASLEWAPDNCRPFFVLARDGWAARGHELRELYDARRAAFARDGHALPELPGLPAPATGRGGEAPIVAFARDLTAIARALDDARIGTRGAVVMLASPQPSAEARALAATPGLENVRWIWLDVTAPHGDADGAEGETDPAIWTAPCRIDRAAQDRETGDLLAAAIAAVAAGASGPPGGARPPVAPPPHPGDPAGAAVPGGAATAPHLHPMLLGVQALRAADAPAAMQRFREARDAAEAAGDAAEAVEMEIMLASTGAGLALERKTPFPPVAALFEAAAARAEAAGLLAAAAKSRFLLGVTAGAAGEIEIGARALLAAAELAARGGAPALRFHALRTASDLASRAGLRARASELAREALDLVRQMDPREAQATGLAQAAAELERALRAPAAAAPGAVAARPVVPEDVSP